MPVGSRTLHRARVFTAALSCAVFGLGILAASPAHAFDAPSAKPEQKRVGFHANREAKIRARGSKGKRGSAHERRELEASRIPNLGHPNLQVKPTKRSEVAVGWSGRATRPRFRDRRRRLPSRDRPSDYGGTLRLGERFVFDVYFAGNPAGMAEAGVIDFTPDTTSPTKSPGGVFTLRGKATTSGVISLFTSMADVMTTQVDASTGAPLHSANLLERNGFGTKIKKRVTQTDFEGRGHIRISDDRDGKTTKRTKTVPSNTFDPLSAMAWVRAQSLDSGQRASAYVIDGRTLLRVDVVGRGSTTLDPLPSIGAGLDVQPGDLNLLEGTVRRVDRYGVPMPEKRTYTFRAYVTNDRRRLLLAIETDMWLGVIRLTLAQYDPPNQDSQLPANVP